MMSVADRAFTADISRYWTKAVLPLGGRRVPYWFPQHRCQRASSAKTQFLTKGLHRGTGIQGTRRDGSTREAHGRGAATQGVGAERKSRPRRNAERARP